MGGNGSRVWHKIKKVNDKSVMLFKQIDSAESNSIQKSVKNSTIISQAYSFTIAGPFSKEINNLEFD